MAAEDIGKDSNEDSGAEAGTATGDRPGKARVHVRVTRGGEGKVSRWSATEKSVFLDVLSATGNITRSAQAVGRTGQSAHHQRRSDAVFAVGWVAAIEAACLKLQASLVARAIGDRDEDAPGAEAAGVCATCGAERGRPFDPDLALAFLRFRATMDGKPPRAGAPAHYRPVPIAEVEASLTRKIAAIVKARGTKRAAGAKKG